MKKKYKTMSIKNYNVSSEIINRRYFCFIFIMVFVFLIILLKLVNLQIGKTEEYKEKLADASVILIDGPSTPRGRIYDKNGKLLVDNKAVKTIYYKKNKNVSIKEEIKLAYIIADNIEVDYSKLTVTDLKNYWILTNSKEASNRLTSEEKEKYAERKLSDSDINKLKFSRVTDSDIEKYNDRDKEAIYIYYLMNTGYSYDEKVIKNSNVTDEEYAYIATNVLKLNGFNVKLDWDRIYLYGDTLKTILGKVSTSSQGLPKELKDEYLANGYSLTDRVGTSYLEYQYESYLKGTKAVYKLSSNNDYVLVSEGSRGNDLYLTIDIDLQRRVEEIMVEEMINAKNERNTEYFNKAFVVVSNPQTGEIYAMSGKQIIWDNQTSSYKVYDYTPGVTTAPITVGSVVKGASMTVGYKTGAIKIGTSFQDTCIKLSGVKEKCSWSKNLGVLNDITAIQLSSNSYQFRTALLVAGINYRYNKYAYIDPKYFELYRNTFGEYGLGVKTGIDLPVESTGYKGVKQDAGLYLNFSIGQYDSYTPIQLAQYINTIANGGKRLKTELVKTVKSSSDSSVIYNYEPVVLNEVNLDWQYRNRIKEAFNAVMRGSLGRGFMGSAPNPSGKTGTSESFYDSDNDGSIDTETITKSFVGYAPSDNPIMSIVVIAPDISKPGNGFTSNVHKRIASRISNHFFGTN